MSPPEARARRGGKKKKKCSAAGEDGKTDGTITSLARLAGEVGKGGSGRPRPGALIPPPFAPPTAFEELEKKTHETSSTFGRGVESGHSSLFFGRRRRDQAAPEREFGLYRCRSKFSVVQSYEGTARFQFSGVRPRCRRGRSGETPYHVAGQG